MVYVDIADRLAGDRRWMTEVASIDGAHPGAAGYLLLSDLIWPTLSDWIRQVADL